MTLKKSLISVAAAGFLVSAITGCSSDSTTPVATTTTTNPTSITAVDGYVLNYQVTATYSDGNESNRSYATTPALANAVTPAKIVAGSTQTAGSAVMDLSKDLTASQIANLVSVNLSYKAQTTDGTTLTYGTFFDANADSKFDAANGDIVAPTTFSMKAPVGYKMITPVTTLVQQRIDQLTATDTNDSNRSEVVALALTQVANGLGLTADKIKNIDPANTVSTDPAYALINAMLGQAIIDNDMPGIATAMGTATAATTVSSALNNIASGATKSTSFYASAAKQLADDAAMINAVSTWNLDALRNQNGQQLSFVPTTLTPGVADINVTQISVGDVNASTLAGSGAKVSFSGLTNTKLSLSTYSDVNISNKAFKLAIDVRAQETHILDDANITSLTILVPMDINSTAGTVESTVSGTVTWEGVKATGATFNGEMNATTFVGTGVGIGLTGGKFAVTSNTLTLPIGTIITQIDTNSSNLANIVDANVSSVKVALMDVNGSVAQLTNGTATATQYWGNTQVASVKGGINITGKTIFANTLTDGRHSGSTATPNVVPNAALSLAVASASENAIQGAGTLANPYILNNNYDYNATLAASTVQTWESNTTFAITSEGAQAAAITDKNSTAINSILYNAADSSAAATADFAFDVNTTSTTAGELNSTIAYKVTDEFGDANTTAIYVTVNRAPSFDENSSSSTVMDWNVTGTITNSTISLVDSAGAVVDSNGTDGNITASGIQIADSDGVSLYTYTEDWNLSVIGAGTGCTYTGNDSNTTLTVGANGDANITLTRSVFGGYQLGVQENNGSNDISCEFTVRAYDQFNYSKIGNANDANITINLR